LKDSIEHIEHEHKYSHIPLEKFHDALSNALSNYYSVEAGNSIMFNANNKEVLLMIKDFFGYDQTKYTVDDNPNRDKLHSMGLTKSLEKFSKNLLGNTNYLLECIRIKLQQHTEFVVNKYVNKDRKTIELTIQSILNYTFKEHTSRAAIYAIIEPLSSPPEKKLYDTISIEFSKS